MELRKNVREAMLESIPSLRAVAISLCGNVDRADDLMQKTLLRAWADMESFQPGTNMSAWMFTMMRNLFREEYGIRTGSGSKPFALARTASAARALICEIRNASDIAEPWHAGIVGPRSMGQWPWRLRTQAPLRHRAR
jgi:hypothetical protein